LNTAILASHGTDSQPGAAAIAALVSAVAAALPDWRIYESFIDVQSPDVPTVLNTAAGDIAADSSAGAPATEGSEVAPVTIAPLLLATGYHVRKDLTEAAEEAEEQGTKVRIVPALGPDERLVEVLARRLEEAGATAQDLVILAVAGSSDPAAQQQSELVHAMLEQRLGHEVQLAYLSATEPRVKDVIPKLKFQNPRKRVAVSSYLLADGYFQTKLEASGAQVVTRPLLGPELPVPQELVDVVISRLNGPDFAG
jgi:sirohydrochlorin ferrochelatase